MRVAADLDRTSLFVWSALCRTVPLRPASIPHVFGSVSVYHSYVCHRDDAKASPKAIPIGGAWQRSR